MSKLRKSIISDLVCDETSLDQGEFSKIAELFLNSYTDIVQKGFPAGTIALAMLGATLNMYKMFELQADLPDILRSVADRIEGESELNN